MDHVAHRLQALLSQTLSPKEREEAEAHLASCAGCRDERDLLLEAHLSIAPLPVREPRSGFAASVALAARDRRADPFRRWIRWALGGVAAAGIAAVAAVALLPGNGLSGRSDDVQVAQRLELFENLDVLQHQEALEDMDVVSVLHTLEARP
ncbi:MAG TPA: zf-HC2 domain-containing protein [Myxococcales bacterium]|nr:zf-HC2 domain-containing protein [Myxococcales bacterium]